MTRPPFEVADVIRIVKNRQFKHYRWPLTWEQIKVLRAIVRCRTSALGGHRDRCSDCGYTVAISYNSCLNKHCPKCQTNARNRWLQKRQRELLPVDYYHLTFSIPHELIPLMWQNKKILFNLMFKTAAATLLEIAADPKHLGAEIGFFGILHTWGQIMNRHPHIHFVVPGGGLSPDHTRWVPLRYQFLLPVQVLSKVFCGKFIAGLREAFQNNRLSFHGKCKRLSNKAAFDSFLYTLSRQDWVVYAKPPFGGPKHVLHYLGRYTHRVAISNHRIVSVSDSEVTFRWKDYKNNNKIRTRTLSCEEFLYRFLQHIFPKGFVRIRHFGLLANRKRKELLALCRVLLNYKPEPELVDCSSESGLWRCPRCHGLMRVIARFSAFKVWLMNIAEPFVPDTS
jgi:predicted Zn-ribbon and HTH transcriptional regulator